MENGPQQDPPRLQCTSHGLRTAVVIAWHFQTELAINTHVTVSKTRAVVSHTHTMVSDIHRAILHAQKGDDSKLLVSDIRTQTSLNGY